MARIRTWQCATLDLHVVMCRFAFLHVVMCRIGFARGNVQNWICTWQCADFLHVVMCKTGFARSNVRLLPNLSQGCLTAPLLLLFLPNECSLATLHFPPSTLPLFPTQLPCGFSWELPKFTAPQLLLQIPWFHFSKFSLFLYLQVKIPLPLCLACVIKKQFCQCHAACSLVLCSIFWN